MRVCNWNRSSDVRKGRRWERAALGLLLLLLAGCSKKQDKPAGNAQEQQDPLTVQVSPELAGQMRVGEPAMHDVEGTLQVAARVETDGSRVARIGSPVSGRILRLLVLEGQTVRRGAVLATLHSTDLSDTQFALVKSTSQENLAVQATKRAEQLVAADVIGRAELERREAEQLQATTQAAAIRTQLHGLGMTDGSIRSLESTRRLTADYPIVSSISGTVLKRDVSVGQVVQPADAAFTVADLSSVWRVADVPEEDAGKLRKGMEVAVRIPALPDERIRGHLSYVSPIVDPALRTVQVRMELQNAQGLFKPAMLAGMTFLGHTERKMTVPQTAVVREENKDYVFVQTGPRKYVLREVALGEESEDRRVLESGVSAGERIVLDGAFHLNNQRKQNAITAGR